MRESYEESIHSLTPRAIEKSWIKNLNKKGTIVPATVTKMDRHHKLLVWVKHDMTTVAGIIVPFLFRLFIQDFSIARGVNE